MRRLPPLNALRAFEAAARHLSFNSAADELYVTPSAISHQIKSLEQYLELPLFHRNRRKVELTAAGEKYLPTIQQALDQIDSATRRLMSNPNSGAVTLSVAPAFLTRWLMPRLSDFQDQYPDVELRMSASNANLDFHQTDIDMSVRYGRGEWKDVEAHLLMGMSVVPVCSPELLKRSKPLQSPEDMREHTLIHVATRMEEWRMWLKAVGIDFNDFGKDLRFSSTSLATGAAMEGLGIALADRQLVDKELARGDLVVPFDIGLDTHSAFYLVYPQDRPLSYAGKAFRDWILEQLQPNGG
ncbi:transcriptional regulator GcvA [Motiliproteus coralliicola]|uniref:Transcriptional regulator GcvA n=1 Tax=Motiliproteus coralliicola TaxID=2283196 RepID=A0A369WML7_9GAMM|nr:transcriptional regulator GcvA [Motiliproteus coralliicola]RDE22453.1 transcriptional regulator GcvA [Motiliproteus coralliicola]